MCGIFGVFGDYDAAKIAYQGIFSQQHRGQESAGIAVSNGNQIKMHKDMGLVTHVFNDSNLEDLSGYIASAQVRYSTAGSSQSKNAQPFLIDSRYNFTISHNGNLINADKLRGELKVDGVHFQSDSDTEVIGHLITRSKKTSFIDCFIDALSYVRGAYSLVVTTEDSMYLARDTFGLKPLCLGKLKHGATVAASETCAFYSTGKESYKAEYIRDIKPGEVLKIDKHGMESYSPFNEKIPYHCIFEHIYFARPDSIVYGIPVSLARINQGKRLAVSDKKSSREGFSPSLISPIPDSGIYSAIGYSQESKTPFNMVFQRNHYAGRSFIEAQEMLRALQADHKLSPVFHIINGNEILLTEDSIVRSLTAKKRIQQLKECNAKKIHMRVACAPIKFPCFYGVDMKTSGELIANELSVPGIQNMLGIDSLAYNSLENLIGATYDALFETYSEKFKTDESRVEFMQNNKFCHACMSGEYPAGTPDDIR